MRWIKGYWHLLHVHHHTLRKRIRQVFYKGDHQLSHFHQVLSFTSLKRDLLFIFFRFVSFPLWKNEEVYSHPVKRWKLINAFLLSSSISTSDIRILSSCTSATIEDQIGGIKRCQCHGKDVCVRIMWLDDDWTVGFDSMYCMYHQSKICLFMFLHQAVYGRDIWYWQSLAISSCGQVHTFCSKCI